MPWSSLSYFVFLLWILTGWTVTAFAAELQYPLSIAVTESRTIYLADRNLPGIWKLENEKLTLFFEGSKTFRTPLNAIRCVALDADGKLLAGDSATREIYRFDDAGKPIGLTHKPATAAAPAPDKSAESKAKGTTVEGPVAEKEVDAKQGAPATAGKKADETQPAKVEKKLDDPSRQPAQRPVYRFGEIGIPMDFAVDKAGDIFVSDLEIHRIVKVAKNGGQAHEFVQIPAPRGLCIDREENLWVVSGRKLVKVSPAGDKATVVEDGTFNFPHTVAIAADMTAYVCDGYEKCIWKVPPGGKPEKLVSGEPFVNPVGMRLVADTLYVVDPRAQAVFLITLDGKLTTRTLKP